MSRDSRNASTNRSGSILPDANNLPIRRTVTDFDRRRTSVAAQSIDKCFGFEDDDDNDDGENETTPKTLVVTSALNRARADLKRFLHGSDTRSETLAKKPMAKEESRNKPNLFKSPTKEKATTAFDAPDKNKQKDIRRAFEAKTAKNVDSAGASTKRVVLFEDDQIVSSIHAFQWNKILRENGFSDLNRSKIDEKVTVVQCGKYVNAVYLSIPRTNMTKTTTTKNLMKKKEGKMRMVAKKLDRNDAKKTR